MANEVTTAAGSVGELVLAEQIMLEREVLRAARSAVVVAPLVVNDRTSVMGKSGLTVSFPRFPALPTSATLSQGSDLSNTAINTTDQTITVAIKGVRIEPTDLLATSDVMHAGTTSGGDPARILNAMRNSEYAQWAADGVVNTIESDLTALFTAFNGGTAIGTTGTNITLANFIEASYTLDAANAPGQKHCVLHSRQWSDLLSALQSATGVIYQGQQGLSAHGGLGAPPRTIDDSGIEADKGNLFDSHVWMSNNCPTVNSAADRSGAMFTRAAMGIGWKWDIRVELQRNASMATTEVVVTACYGVSELVDGYGVPIETDA